MKSVGLICVFSPGGCVVYLLMKLANNHVISMQMLQEKLGIIYLNITSSTKYAYAKISKCNTKYSAVEKH